MLEEHYNCGGDVLCFVFVCYKRASERNVCDRVVNLWRAATSLGAKTRLETPVFCI